jgi:hypothetical protein
VGLFCVDPSTIGRCIGGWYLQSENRTATKAKKIAFACCVNTIHTIFSAVEDWKTDFVVVVGNVHCCTSGNVVTDVHNVVV